MDSEDKSRHDTLPASDECEKRPIYDIKNQKLEILWQIEQYMKEFGDDDDKLSELQTWTDLVAKNNLTTLPSTIGLCTYLVNVDISFNQLESLPSFMAGLAQLKNLDLSNNNFSKFPSTVCSLPQLEKLNMNYNQLSSVDPNIFMMTSLKDLDLSTNRLSDFPEPVCRMPCLEKLNLRGNMLTGVHQDISKMTSLVDLNLERNKFNEIPKSVFKLSQLKKLNMSYNEVSSVDSDISMMASLQYLDLSDNVFKEFPTAVCSLRQLENLLLYENQLTDVHLDISKLTSLRNLDLSWNDFTAFPVSVCRLSLLRSLAMFDNQLTNLHPDILNMSSLTALNLSMNKLADIHAAVYSLPKLKKLLIYGNRLTCLHPDITKAISLTDLDIGKNMFKEFPTDVCSLPDLEDLGLAGNMNLVNVPASIAKLSKLKRLHLNNTKITHLPLQLEHLGQLEELNVENAPLIQPPESVWKGGKDAIFRYLRSLRETKAVKTNKLQLNILGETAGGKSSLAQSLEKEEPRLTAEADRTCVIEQGTWEPEGENITLNINDFGGHDVYKVGYPVFINKNGSTLITFDLSQYDPLNANHYKRQIGDWVRTIQYQTPNMQLAICGTHLDKVDEMQARAACEDVQRRIRDDIPNEVNWIKMQIGKISKKNFKDKNLQEAYQRKLDHLHELSRVSFGIHEEIFAISSADMSGFPVLTQHLISLAGERGVVLPETWVDVMHEIERKKYEADHNTLSMETVRSLVQDVASKNGSTKTMSPEAISKAIGDILNYMSSSGDVVWFATAPSLKEVIFHKQEVLANLLKAILHHEMDQQFKDLLHGCGFTKNKVAETAEDFLKRGIISREAMYVLWKPFGLLHWEEDAMIELLQTMELCYMVEQAGDTPDRDKDTFHFPWLLTECRPPSIEDKWPDKIPSDLVQFTLQFYTPHRCPDGLFERLSVKITKHIGIFKRRRVDWKDGVYAEDGACKLQLAHQQEGQDWLITVAVRGRQPIKMWELLIKIHRDMLDILHQNWPGLSYDRYLLCPNCIQEGSETPTTYPGEILDDPFNRPDHDVLPCDNALDGYVPSRLVYPALSGYTRQHMLRINRVVLVENLTDSGIRDMLNRLQADGMFTDREAETVRTTDTRFDRAEEFLDLLVKKEDRAFDILYDYLMSSGQKHIAKMIHE